MGDREEELRRGSCSGEVGRSSAGRGVDGGGVGRAGVWCSEGRGHGEVGRELLDSTGAGLLRRGGRRLEAMRVASLWENGTRTSGGVL